MRSATRFATALAGAALALAGAGLAPAGAATGHAGAESVGGVQWASATAAKIHPGIVITIAQVKCVVGFVLTDGRRVFLAIPASCSGVSNGQPTDGCSEAQVPTGLPVSVPGARHKATLVYSSFTRMQLRGETRANMCANNDLTLLRLDRRDIKRTNPSVPFVGGPTGVSQAQPALPDQLTVVLTAATKAQAVSTGGGGWVHDTMVDGQVGAANVGSPVLTDNGRALGMVSFVPQQGGPGKTSVCDLFREIRALQHTAGFAHVHLAKGTAHYVPPAGF